MKKRFFGVLLALAALGLMAGSAMAAVEVSVSLTATVTPASGTASTTDLSFKVADADLLGLTSVDIMLRGRPFINVLASADKYLVGPDSASVNVSSSTDKLTFKVGQSTDKKDNDVVAYVEDAKTKEAKVFDGSLSESSVLLLKVTLSGDLGQGVANTALVKVNANFATAIEGVGNVELPKTFSGANGSEELFVTLTPEQQAAAIKRAEGPSVSIATVGGMALNKLLVNAVAGTLDTAVEDPALEASQATASQAKEIAKKADVDGLKAVLPSMGLTNKNGAAYVFAVRNLSAETKKAVTAGELGVYVFNRTKSDPDYRTAKEAEDAIFLIYDKSQAEFRQVEDGDDFDYLFFAFQNAPGTYQPFLATGIASPSNPSEITPTGTPSTPSTPSEPTGTPSSPSSPSSPTSTPKKSSGSSGCDMGMVSGLAVLLAALLPLRKVRK